jgi:small subunit ribosomal protein S6
MKKNYELSCLIPVETTEEETKSFSDKIEAIIKQEQGEAIKAKRPSLKKLGYPIKKNREAIFLVFDFSIEKGSLLGLEKNLKLESKIIRMMIVERKKPEEIAHIDSLIKKEIFFEVENKSALASPKPIETEAGLAETAAVKEESHKPKFEKVEIGEIDKKIEEMLKD